MLKTDAPVKQTAWTWYKNYNINITPSSLHYLGLGGGVAFSAGAIIYKSPFIRTAVRFAPNYIYASCATAATAAASSSVAPLALGLLTGGGLYYFFCRNKIKKYFNSYSLSEAKNLADFKREVIQGILIFKKITEDIAKIKTQITDSIAIETAERATIEILTAQKDLLERDLQSTRDLLLDALRELKNTENVDIQELEQLMKDSGVTVHDLNSANNPKLDMGL